MNIVQKTLTSLFLSAACATGAAAQNQSPTNVLADAICDAAKDHKYILVGDTNHGSSETKEVFFNETLVTQIRECLPTNIFVFEQPADQMQLLEAEWADIEDSKREIAENRGELAELEAEYAEVQASPERQETLNQRIANSEMLTMIYGDYKGYYEQQIMTRQEMIILSEQILSWTPPIVTQLGLMRENGFDIRFYDPGYDLPPEDYDIVNMLQDAYVDDSACVNITLLFSIASASDKPAEDFNRMMELLRARDDDNPIIANTILQNHPDGAVIFYGAGHMNGINDLDELLGQEDSLTITIEEDYNRQDSEGTDSFKKLAPHVFPTLENPDQVYDIASNNILTPTRDPNQAEYEQTTEEEFNACLANLPRRMQDGFTRNGGANLTYDDYRWLMDEDRTGVPTILENWVTPNHP